MIEEVLQHLGRLHELSSEWDAQSDRANQAAALVESILAEKLNLGIEGSVSIDGNGDEYGPNWEEFLCFGRFKDGKYRLYIKEINYQDQDMSDGSYATVTTAWSSCPRDQRLKAFNFLPKLLRQLIEYLQQQIENLRASTDSVEKLVEFAATAKKGGKK